VDAAPPIGDAWGAALRDHLEGRSVPTPVLEVEGGSSGPAMHPEWFFQPVEAWDPLERELLADLEAPVLDLGAGAGRAALHLQERGLEVVAVESSPGAAEVCRRRGVVDVRVQDLVDPPADRPWRTVLLLCGNLGLGGSWDGNRRLLTVLAERCAPGAVLVGDSVDGAPRPQVRLRFRHAGMATSWWDQRNVAPHEVDALVDGTGWAVEDRRVRGVEHWVRLRRRGGTGGAWHRTDR
jgi:SAM-dependent methyltransferase